MPSSEWPVDGEVLRDLPFTPAPDAEYANGHPRATGGSLGREQFESFADVLRSRATLGRP